MEKQYSVQFFTNFVENLQNLCHTCLDFSQSVEVSGYVCVEIDNVKKERYVLSEMIQSNGRSISESYCTKVFKSTPSGPGRSNFRDITNETSSVLREACMPQQIYTSGIHRIPFNIRHQSASSTPSNSRQSTPKTKISFQHQPQNVTSTSPSHNSTSDSQVLNGDKRARELQRHSSLGGNKIDFELSSGSQASGSSSTTTTNSNLGKRCFPDTSVIKSEDGDVVIIKEEPGSEEQDEDDSGEPPSVKRREESFRFPEALTADFTQTRLAESTFQPHDSSVLVSDGIDSAEYLRQEDLGDADVLCSSNVSNDDDISLNVAFDESCFRRDGNTSKAATRTTGSRQKLYTVEALMEAVSVIKEGAITLTKASEVYGIPKTTLHDYVHGKYNNGLDGPGRKPILSSEEEKKLAGWIIHMRKTGINLSKKELFCVVQKVVTDNGRANPFINNKPGYGWYQAFQKRHLYSEGGKLELVTKHTSPGPDTISYLFNSFKEYVASGMK